MIFLIFRYQFVQPKEFIISTGQIKATSSTEKKIKKMDQVHTLYPEEGVNYTHLLFFFPV